MGRPHLNELRGRKSAMPIPRELTALAGLYGTGKMKILWKSLGCGEFDLVALKPQAFSRDATAERAGRKAVPLN